MKKGAIWPYLIAGALAIHVIVSLVVVFVATSDPSYAVEENYYQKAMEWDKKRAQDHTNEQLGWTVEWSVERPQSPGQEARIEVTLLDGAGTALSGAGIAVQALHNARSSDILTTDLSETGEAGLYEATLPMAHDGRWEMRFRVDHDGRSFTHSETRHLYVEGSWK